MSDTFPNIHSKTRTVAELREEYNTLARLHSQVSLAAASEHDPQLRRVGRDLDRARDALRRAQATEDARS